MSTLQAINLKHPSSASNNIVLDSSGNASVSGNALFNSGYGSAAVAYGCRAWVNFNGTGTVAIRASGNVSSITDNNTGDYTINFTNAMPDANYCAVAASTVSTTTPDANAGVEGESFGSYAAGSVRMFTSYGATGINDKFVVTVAIFR